MHELGLTVDAAVADAVCDHLSDACGALAVTMEDADAGSADEQPVFDEPGIAGEGAWRRARVTALFDGEAPAIAAAGAVAAAYGGVRVRSIDVLDERDWVRLTQSQFGPIEVAPSFWIVPTWARVPEGATRVVRLDPGMAFGTGTHPTTRMVLRWMVAAATGRAGARQERVLDYGCGSGILAVAAKVLGADSVDAVDIDPAAVAATQKNASANGVAVDAGPPELANGRYALVVANILATPLKLLAPLLAGHLAADGDLVLAGVLERQEDDLRDAYAPWLDLSVADRDDGWILLHGCRAACPEADTP